ncbi:EpsD family peptidyl-prolyl cis-trans isomerase [Chlorobaculum limnaeum]|uniref:EpsD family peptidyl-prolyl cis-trans isomerase n=1 Tax=Chlorobaculum limnaeum TaxID=274537 RepID=UPI001470A188|nr:EpsD family peptidyl-prolyl cis-trans isomerase [Chlorobaculum limnaeum]
MKILSGIFWVLVLFVVSGCSSQSAKESPGSVAAVVNGVEITHGEIEYFARKSVPPGAATAETIEQKKAILANLVRMELLAQKAQEMGLDKDPDFTLALYEARRQVLAGMAESKLVKDVKPVTSETANSLVENNPRLFSNRKLLVYDEILIQGVDVPFLESMISMNEKGATEEQLIEVLNSRKKVFQKTTRSQTSDKIQPVILDVLLKSTPNRPIIARVEDKFSMILMLHKVLPVPLQGAQATQAAMSMAYAQQRNVLMAKSMTELLNNAKITYYGDYAKTSAGEQKVTGLPVPDQQRAARKTYKSVGYGAILSVSVIFAMLVLTASMRILRGGLWLPRLWPSSSIPDEPKTQYEWAYEAYKIEKFYIGFMALVIIAVLAFEIYLLAQYLPIPGIIASVLSGVLLGVAGSRVFSLAVLKGLSHKVYAVLVVVFTVPVVFGLLFIMTHPGV